MACFLQDQVVPGEGTGRTISVPVHWESQTLCVQVFQVRSGTDEWKICEDKFMSMPVKINHIVRVQNLWLMEVYQFNKWRMYKRNDGTINELTLFHGTKGNDPMVVCKGEDGFDLRLSKKGSWGHALYFSENIMYADKFAHITSEGNRELLLANVLVGETYDFGTSRQQEMKMPPIKIESKQNLLNVKYDSVFGITKDARVYMIYEAHKAYPAYVVNYQYETLL